MTTSEGGKYYGKCKNNNSISIEMCSTKKNTKSLSATDDDWSITTKTVNNALELVKQSEQMKIKQESKPTTLQQNDGMYNIANDEVNKVQNPASDNLTEVPADYHGKGHHDRQICDWGA